MMCMIGGHRQNLGDLAVSDLLFAYGTLRHGHAPSEIAAAVARLRPLGQGVIRGRLYELDGYPGVVLDPFTGEKILGTIFQLPKDSDLLAQFDAYEGFDPEDLPGSLFVRQVHPVQLDTGDEVPCWIYLYNERSARL